MQSTPEYLSSFSHKLVRGCEARAENGVTLFTPDGIASYNALWIRDFSYMVEYAGQSITDQEIEDCVRFAIGGRRADGWMPDRIYADGTPVYAAGETGKPIGKANLDNTPFLVFIVSDLLARLPKPKAALLFTEWQPYLERGLSALPLSDDGLIYSDPEQPHSPYGFTDTVAKTGCLMMESLLLWRACRKMEWMTREFSSISALLWTSIAERIEKSICQLYDPESGMFFAATQDCKQIDIWGSAYLVYIGFPAPDAKAGILTYLQDHIKDYTFEGQIRHLPKGEYWQRLLIDVPRETYQNGAYWATATGWLAWCLYQTEPKKAAELINAAVRYLRREGSFECVNEGYQKLPSFVVSVTNIAGGLRRILAEAPSFIGLLEDL